MGQVACSVSRVVVTWHTSLRVCPFTGLCRCGLATGHMVLIHMAHAVYHYKQLGHGFAQLMSSRGSLVVTDQTGAALEHA